MESKQQGDRQLQEYPKSVEKRTGILMPKNKHNNLITNKIN
ncbi:hypothetical protein [Aquimarina atlantica]|nr:hypothetical protein [Aquimarina atlantica]